MQRPAVPWRKGGPGDRPGRQCRRNWLAPALPLLAVRRVLHLKWLGTLAGYLPGSETHVLLSVSHTLLQLAPGLIHPGTPLQTHLKE